MDDLMEYEPTPMLYIVELDRNHVSVLISAARTASVAPGITRVESDLILEAIESLWKQTVNL